jgi:hypothetical protein
VGDYQRTFEWSTETGPASRPAEWRAEVRDLWEDFYSFVYRQGKGHFCGVLLLDATAAHTVRIVDGQQRITCVFLLLLAIRDHLFDCRKLRSIEIPFDCQWLEQIEFANRLVLHDDPTDRPADRDIFESIASRAKPADDSHPLVRAYRFFKQEVADKFEDNVTTVAAFLNHIGQHVTFLEVRLSVGDDAMRMFERLNARGRQVTSSLLLQNLLGFQDQTREDPIGREAVQLLTDLQESFSETDLQTFLGLLPRRLAIETIHNADYARFKKYRDEAEKREQLRTWLAQIRRCREIYKSVINAPNAQSPFATFYYFASPSLLPAVVRVAEVFGEVSTEIQWLECLTIRLFFRHTKPSHAFASHGGAICQALSGADQSATARETARLELLKVLKTANVPDAVFIQDFARKPIYGNGQKRGQTRYILECLENWMNQQVPGRVSFQHGCSIEHVYPQQPSEDQSASGPLHGTTLRGLVHTIGNLTILLFPDNSRFGNLPYARKRPFYLDPAKAAESDPELRVPRVPTTLRLNSTFSAYPVWDLEAIQRRGAMLAQEACKIWPEVPQV